MGSYKQAFFVNRRPKKYRYKFNRKLNSCPQRKGIVIQLRFVKPKKPNSAIRKIALCKLTSKKTFNRTHKALVYIPGQGHNLHKHSRVLVRAGRIPDLPGLHYRMIRGKYDLSWTETFTRVNRRSKYGVPR